MTTQTKPDLVFENPIRDLLAQRGPMTGKQLIDALDSKNYLGVWKACFESELFRTVNCARYYLRYDVTRDNLLRLSPSVLRDFFSFTLIYLSDQKSEAVHRSVLLANNHRVISRKKMKTARDAILSIDPELRGLLKRDACSFIAGDIAYFLAHEEERRHPEMETVINGSDIDILMVHNDALDPAVIEKAEKQMLGFKFRALKDVRIGQEIDFLFKPISKMKSQFDYSDIHQKIACKILYESFFLFGNLEMYEELSADLQFSGVVEKIEADFLIALAQRQDTIKKIFNLDSTENVELDPEIESLFYFSQERLEFQ